ncbi:Uncharacterized protein PECH_002313 [Penicillium ucsense]|uniref:Uncharacterized protein n=1 Tax=Penicillium ucsense TaxID=2839758 RepID=A0A8J8VWQ6_9EURO|nr:Uncharacterized protein PECM_001902 [Penicillium ucsense]KAF7731061.1 Uncharacterized protein PECH_002313 [Penicillium ucsense]
MSQSPPRSITSTGSESNNSTRLRSSSAQGRHSASNSKSFSLEVNPFDTALPPITHSHPPVSTHRRTGSTLKTVMRKIFNRKRQSQGEGMIASPAETYFSLQGKSPEPIVGKSFLAAPSPPPSKCNSPLSEANLQLATNCLSPNSLVSSSLVPAGLALPPRRASLPSVIFSEDESRYGVASAVSDPQENQSVISGRKSQYSALRHRRRSRSIGALRSPTREQPGSPAPWVSRTISFPQTTKDPKSSLPKQEIPVTERASRRPSTGTTFTSQTKGSEAPTSPFPEINPDRVSLLPNMANLVRAMQQDDSLTVEQRLNTMEVKMIDLEFAIARMQTSSTSSTPTIEKHPERERKRSTPRRKEKALPQVPKQSSRPISNNRDKSKVPKTSTTEPKGQPKSTSPNRTDTEKPEISRADPSPISANDFNGISIEQYSALVTLLRREQTARRNLESQVSSLKKDIRQMQRAALHSMEMGGTMYPISNADSQEFLRFRRALDGSECDSPRRANDEKGMNSAFETESDYDPYGPPKWEREGDREKGRIQELKLGPPGKRLATTAIG